MSRTDIIRELNDTFRKTLMLCQHGKVVLTPGIANLPEHDQAIVITNVMEFQEFSPENDPYGEHDFGAFSHNGIKYFWKIDYYDRSMHMHSPDPADPAVTQRVLTIMEASEY